MGISEFVCKVQSIRGGLEAHASLRVAESPFHDLAPKKAQAAVAERSSHDLVSLLSDPCSPKIGEDRKTDQEVVKLLIRASR